MEPGRGAATVAAAADAVVARASITRASLAGREAAAALAAVDAVPLKEPGMNIVLMQALFRGSLARKRVERLRKGRGMKAEVWPPPPTSRCRRTRTCSTSSGGTPRRRRCSR